MIWYLSATGLAVAAVLLGPTVVCFVRRRHRWGWWRLDGLIYVRRSCLTCGIKQTAESEFWIKITTPEPPPTEPMPAVRTDTQVTLTRPLPPGGAGAVVDAIS
jgi:hypothetical protein